MGVSVLLALALAVLWPAAAQAQCDAGRLGRAAEGLKAARAALLALKTADMETDVGPAAQAAIAAMKLKLAAFVDAAVSCQGDRKSLAAMLAGAAVAPPKDGTGGYGSSVDFAVASPHAGLLAVTARFAIPCGSDSMVLFFEPASDGWREVLRLQSKPYRTVAGAYDFFDYRVSPPDAAGGWFVAQKNIAPWCSSTWSTIRYSVLRPSGDPRKPRVLLDASDDVWWGGGDEGRLAVGRDEVTLRFHAQSIDLGVHNREWVRHFSVRGDHAIRTPPLAGSPRDFAEEWIQSDWKTVAPWTATASLAALHDKMHGQLRFDYIAVRACGAGRTQIAITDSDKDTGDYFLIVGGRADFRMLDVRRIADPACKGPILFAPP